MKIMVSNIDPVLEKRNLRMTMIMSIVGINIDLIDHGLLII